MGIVVEAELGKVGNAGNAADVEHPLDTYTDVQQAVEFVERTGCDSLAIAIGNAHGNYVAKPNLAFDRLRELRAALRCSPGAARRKRHPGRPVRPLRRGGHEQVQHLHGIQYDALQRHEGFAGSAEQGRAGQVLCDCKEACKELVRHKIRIVNPKGLRVV